MKYWDAICPVCGHELKCYADDLFSDGTIQRKYTCDNCVKTIIIIDEVSSCMKTLDDFMGE